MMGTFATMLAKSRIPTPADRYHADAAGEIEAVDGILKIVRIKVHYTLKLKPEKRSDAAKAFEVYLPRCPSAQSVKEAIKISHAVKYEDL